ncbi:ribonuclease HI [Candidatus Saccharibacteria bacterium]|nr:ribonuclease HI [Candidatus Saccharibacteria bacterium]
MIILWTDGSAEPNPGPGGFAVIEQAPDGSGRPVALGRDKATTNIRMEGSALIAAIKYADKKPVEIHTDSQFWINVLTKWAPGWAALDWHKKDELIHDNIGEVIGYKPTAIKNLDLVQELYKLYTENPVNLVWVKGHVGTAMNELADEWANKARKGTTLAN